MKTEVSRYGHFNSHERDIDHRDSTGLFSRSVMTELECKVNDAGNSAEWSARMSGPGRREYTF